MNSAKLPFKILQYFGIWRPKSWTSQWAIQFYNIYSFLIIVSLLASLIFFSVDSIQTRNDLESLTETLFQTAAFFSLTFKVLYIFMHRADIIVFDEMFSEIHCLPRDVCELAIIEKFDNSNRWNTKLFLILSIGIILTTWARGSSDTLPLRMWIPYNTDSKSIFWIIYLFEMVLTVIVVVLLVTIDCYITGLMQQICAQLEILNHRLCLVTNLVQETDETDDNFLSELKIRDCIVLHSHLYLAGQRLNNILSSTAFLQFFITISALCTLVYQLSITDIYTRTFWFAFTGCNNYLGEIFLLCWYGQEMIDKSLAIRAGTFESDWTYLSPVSKKYLFVISMRAGQPIELCGASLVTICIETFLKILKVSYSAFNLMQSLD